MKLVPYRAPINTGHHRTKSNLLGYLVPEYMPCCNCVWWVYKDFTAVWRNTLQRMRGNGALSHNKFQIVNVLSWVVLGLCVSQLRVCSNTNTLRSFL